MFELNNLKNEAILRDLFIFQSWQRKKRSNSSRLPFCIWQHQNQSNSARLPSQMESWEQDWWPRTNAFCVFFDSFCLKYCACTKKWIWVIRSAAPVTQNHLSKPEDLMLQNATPGNQCPDLLTSLMNMSLVLRLPRKMHLCRSSSSVPRLPSFLEILQNPHILLTFDKVHNPLRLPRETTSEHPKVVRACCVFNILTSERASCHNGVHFSTSQLPKVVRTWCVLYILTSKCASRHNGIHFFDISTSKSGLNPLIFLHFWLRNVLRATTARTFSTSQVPKVLRTRQFFTLLTLLRATTACNFSSLMWPACSAPAAVASLLFDPPELQIIGKTQCFATFLPFHAPPSSFFWDFLFFDLLSSSLLFSSLLFSSLLFSSLLFSDSSHRCFSSVHIVGRCRKFDFQTSFGNMLHVYMIIHTYTHTYIHTYIQTDRQTDIQTYIHTYMHAYIQTDRQTDMHTYIHTYIHPCMYIAIDMRTLYP